MAYFTEAELESHMGITISGTTEPNSTQIGLMATEISAMYDGLAQQTEGDETPDEYVKQACLMVASFRVGRIRKGLTPDPVIEMDIIQKFLKKTPTQLHYNQVYPSRSGKWA